jgi:hypothetical protein
MNKFFRFLGTLALAVIGLCCASFPVFAQDEEPVPALNVSHDRIFAFESPEVAAPIAYTRFASFEQSFNVAIPFKFASTDSDLIVVLFCFSKSQTVARHLIGSTLYGSLYGLNGRELSGAMFSQAVTRNRYRDIHLVRSSQSAALALFGSRFG